MKGLVACLASVIGLCLLVAGCGANAGPVTERNYDFDGFSEVKVSSAFEVEIAPADSYSISITAQEKLFEHIRVSRTGKTLEIGMQQSLGTWLSSWGYRSPKARITMPSLTGLELSGASKGTAEAFKLSGDVRMVVSGASSLKIDIEAEDASIGVSGASRIQGTLKCADINMEVSGASKIELTGTGANLNLEVSGASRADLRDFAAHDGEVTLSGASHGTVSLDESMTVELSGASSLEYSGSPAVDIKSISGASTIRKR